MFEFLTGVLSGAPALAPALGPERRRRHTQNTMLLVIDVAAFRPPAEFARDADELTDIIKRLPPREGFAEILLPGERGRRSEEARRAGGIPLPPATWDALGRMAQGLGQDLPPVLSPSAIQA
jgi:ureidoglycolate dehydrogenase (NAD+)